MKKIILTGGGTAGHVTPNLALIPHLKNYELHYVGAANGIEQRLTAAYPELSFHAVRCVKLQRNLSPRNAAIPFALLRGVLQSKKLLKELQPSVVFSKGGFAALPLTLATGKNVPLVLHESDCSLGLANRLAVKKCRYLCTTFAPLAEQYENGVYTGTPMRRELYFGSKQKAETLSGLYGRKNLLIMGGSQGALAINEAVYAALPTLSAYFDVIHLCGKSGRMHEQRPHYFQLPYSDAIADLFAWADVCVSRGGSNSLAELIALKIPSLIIPLPKSSTSRGDQQLNALYYEKAGCIRTLSQEELTAGKLIHEVLQTAEKAPALIAAMEKTPSPDGTRKIVELIVRLAESEG